MSSDSPQYDTLRPPHPLAVELIERLRERPGAPILEIGRGSGRNRRALERAGFTVTDFAESEPHGAIHAAAISTHALLHGTPPGIATLVSRIADRLESGAPLYGTFGSVRDARFGIGERIDEATYAPLNGDEAGVPHAFFAEPELRAMLADRWVVESLTEQNVDEIAGSWAHELEPLRESVHWFARLRKR